MSEGNDGQEGELTLLHRCSFPRLSPSPGNLGTGQKNRQGLDVFQLRRIDGLQGFQQGIETIRHLGEFGLAYLQPNSMAQGPYLLCGQVLHVRLLLCEFARKKENPSLEETIASFPGFGMAPEGHFLYSSSLARNE